MLATRCCEGAGKDILGRGQMTVNFSQGNRLVTTPWANAHLFNARNIPKVNRETKRQTLKPCEEVTINGDDKEH